MIKITELDYILESHFKDTSTSFSEPQADMEIKIDKTGLKPLMYSFDKNLSKEYKGGLFPFFAKKKGVCSICDYIIFCINNGKLYALVIELKKGKAGTLKQLDAAECFVNYIIATYNRVKNSSIECNIRKISIKAPKLVKKKTKMSEIKYDATNHTFLSTSKFYLKPHLK